MNSKLYGCCTALSCLIVLLLPIISQANVITVRQDGTGDYLTIPEAVAVAAVNDTIEVGSGIYTEWIDVSIPLIFMSVAGAESTVLNGQNSHRHMTFLSGVGSKVTGFKFINGYYPGSGGSIRVMDGSVVAIHDCIFEDNAADFDGGAIIVATNPSRLDVFNSVFIRNNSSHNGGACNAILGGQLNFTDCTFIDNSTDIFSGAIACDNGSMDVSGCLFRGNTSGDVAGAIYYYLSSGLIKNNTFYANTSPYYASVMIDYSSSTTVTRNIFSNDAAGYGLWYRSYPGSHTCNLFWNNAGGAISGDVLDSSEIIADPYFCDPASNDFTLAYTSPASAEHSPCGQLIGAFPAACEDEALVAEPVIISINDVPNDQGRQARIKWHKSLYDAPDDNVVITGYGIYRSQGAFSPAIESKPGAFPDNPRRDSALDGWDYIATVPARGDSVYQYVAPTLCDSTIVGGICWSVFFVSALTPDPLVYFDSPPDSGYSVDNLPPFGPQGFTVAYNACSNNELIWEACNDEDFWLYRIYRGNSEDFIPASGNLTHSTQDISWIDPSPDCWQYYYKIASVDFAGNESDPVSPETVTSAGMNLAPKIFALYQNSPNPFNQATTISYDVPESGGRVTLKIFDVSGRLVRTLVDGQKSLGKKTVPWDGKDDGGQSVASGVYFFQLQAPGFKKVLKMVLVE